jgi:hypothetical protein
LEEGSPMVSDGWGKKNGIRVKIELLKENECKYNEKEIAIIGQI